MPDAIQDLLRSKTTAELLDLADKHVGDLCAKRKRWTMCVPVQWDDSDVLICGALRRARDEIAKPMVVVAGDPEMRARISKADEDLAAAQLRINDLEAQLSAALVRAQNGERFKTFVHTTLDHIDVPKELPEGEHSKEGCRVGDRLDWVAQKIADLEEIKGIVKDIQACSNSRWKRQKIAEAALEIAGFTRCDGPAGWKPPTGRKLLSLSIRRFKISNDITTRGAQPTADGVWCCYRDIVDWEQGNPISPPLGDTVGSVGQQPHQALRHDLKCWPRFFKAVADGSKTFEVRKADRSFAVGDTLLLREWDPNTEAYTSAEPIERIVTYILGEDSPFGFKGYAVLGISAP